MHLSGYYLNIRRMSFLFLFTTQEHLCLYVYKIKERSDIIQYKNNKKALIYFYGE